MLRHLIELGNRFVDLGDALVLVGGGRRYLANDVRDAHIRAAIERFTQAAGIDAVAMVPLSALHGWNVVSQAPEANWCGYSGPTLLQILEQLPDRPLETTQALAFPVQWVEKFSHLPATVESRRVFWGRVATGQVQAGQQVPVFPGGQVATVVKLLNHARLPLQQLSSSGGGIVLDRELDISRGDWLVAAETDGVAPPVPATLPDSGFDRSDSPLAALDAMLATVAWLDNESLVTSRVYWALHGHRWVKARVTRILHWLDIHTLARQDAHSLEANAIGQVELTFQEPLFAASYQQSRVLGAMVLVDTRTHNTAAAVMLH